MTQENCKFGDIVAAVVIGYLILDLIGCIAWAMSGQSPVDSFYIGTVSRNIIIAVVNFF